MNLDSYTAVVTSLTTALGTAVPTLLTAAAALGGGLVAFRIGWGFVKSLVR